MESRVFSVSMLFSFEEYLYFKDWYETQTRKGFYAFLFPKIDSIAKPLVRYRFKSDGLPQYSNIGGDMISCNMRWEELD